MKVSNSKLNPSLQSEAARNRQVDGKEQESASNAKAGDLVGSTKVNLSDRAQQLSKAKEIAGDLDSIDEAKVARLQKLIDEGQYKVDAEAIADRLVDSHLSFNE